MYNYTKYKIALNFNRPCKLYLGLNKGTISISMIDVVIKTKYKTINSANNPIKRHEYG